MEETNDRQYIYLYDLEQKVNSELDLYSSGMWSTPLRKKLEARREQNKLKSLLSTIKTNDSITKEEMKKLFGDVKYRIELKQDYNSDKIKPIVRVLGLTFSRANESKISVEKTPDGILIYKNDDEKVLEFSKSFELERDLLKIIEDAEYYYKKYKIPIAAISDDYLSLRHDSYFMSKSFLTLGENKNLFDEIATYDQKGNETLVKARLTSDLKFYVQSLNDDNYDYKNLLVAVNELPEVLQTVASELLDNQSKNVPVDTINYQKIKRIVYSDINYYLTGEWSSDLKNKLERTRDSYQRQFLKLSLPIKTKEVYTKELINKIFGQTKYQFYLKQKYGYLSVKPQIGIILTTTIKENVQEQTYIFVEKSRDGNIIVTDNYSLHHHELDDYLKEVCLDIINNAEYIFERYGAVFEVDNPFSRCDKFLQLEKTKYYDFCQTKENVKIGIDQDDDDFLTKVFPELKKYRENENIKFIELSDTLRNILKQSGIRVGYTTYRDISTMIENDLEEYVSDKWIEPLEMRIKSVKDSLYKKKFKALLLNQKDVINSLELLEKYFSGYKSTFRLSNNGDIVRLEPTISIISKHVDTYANRWQETIHLSLDVSNRKIKAVNDNGVIVEEIGKWFKDDALNIIEKIDKLCKKYQTDIRVIASEEKFFTTKIIIEKKHSSLGKTERDITYKGDILPNAATIFFPELKEYEKDIDKEININELSIELQNILLSDRNDLIVKKDVEDNISIESTEDDYIKAQLSHIKEYELPQNTLLWAIEEMNSNLSKPKALIGQIKNSSNEIEDICYYVSNNQETKVELTLTDKSVISITSNNINSTLLPSAIENSRANINDLIITLSEIKSIYGIEIKNGKADLDKYADLVNKRYTEIEKEIECFDDTIKLGIDEYTKSELLIKKSELALFKDKFKKDEGLELATIEDGIFKVKLVFTDDIEIDTIITPNPAMLEGHVMEEDKINNYIKDHKKEILQGLKITSDRMVKELSPTKVKVVK